MNALGLDLGGTTLKLVVLDADDLLVERRWIPVPAADPVDFVLTTTRRSVTEYEADTVGVGLAGLVEHPAGVFVWGPHLPGESVPYRSLLSAELGFDVAVDNDANCAAFAEWALGAGEMTDPLLMITLGTGIGAGMISAGRVYRGRSFAGEVGHMELVEDGEQCSCGRRGCWETLVSGARLDRLARELAEADPDGPVAASAGRSEPTGLHLAEAAAAGDTRAAEAVSEVGRWLGRGLANLVLALDPARIVLGGAAAAAGRPLFEAAEAVVEEAMSGAAVRPPVPIAPAHFGALSGAVGAALAGRRVHNGVYDW